MSIYRNKECPYCHKAFTDSDNIVVCSGCGIAHHAECWNENHGCSTYGCDGKPRPVSKFDFKVPSVLYSKAPVWPRIWASIIDSLISWAASAVGLIILSAIGAVNLFGYHHMYFSDYAFYSSASTGWYIFGLIVIIAGMVWGFIYSFIKDGMGRGQSYGKRAVGLMVVDTSANTPCSMGKSALRSLILNLLCAIPLGKFVEPIMILANDNGRRLGDMAAGTQVVSVKEYNESVKQEDRWESM